MLDPTTVSLSTALAGMIFFYMFLRGRGTFRKMRARAGAAAERRRQDRRQEDRRKNSVPPGPWQPERRQGERRAAERRSTAPSNPLSKPILEREEAVRRIREQRVAERRDALLKDLDEQARRTLAVERTLRGKDEGRPEA